MWAIEAAWCAAVAEGGSVTSLAAEEEALAGQLALAETSGEDAVRLDAELAGARAEQERVASELRAAAEAAAAVPTRTRVDMTAPSRACEVSCRVRAG